MGGEVHHVERLSMYHLVRPRGYCEVGVETSWPKMTINMDHARVKLSDDYCDVMCQLSTAICQELVRRAMPVTHGLPKRQVLLLSDVSAGPFLAQLREDYSTFLEICDTEFPGQESFVQRSVFQLMPTKQLVALCREEAWTCTQRCHPAGGSIDTSLSGHSFYVHSSVINSLGSSCSDVCADFGCSENSPHHLCKSSQAA